VLLHASAGAEVSEVATRSGRNQKALAATSATADAGFVTVLELFTSHDGVVRVGVGLLDGEDANSAAGHEVLDCNQAPLAVIVEAVEVEVPNCE